MTPREAERLIMRDGWYRVPSNSGGHRQYEHPTKKGKVTIPFHGKPKDLRKRTVKEIMRQAGLWE